VKVVISGSGGYDWAEVCCSSIHLALGPINTQKTVGSEAVTQRQLDWSLLLAAAMIHSSFFILAEDVSYP
jgi:hypothetical protein